MIFFVLVAKYVIPSNTQNSIQMKNLSTEYLFIFWGQYLVTSFLNISVNWFCEISHLFVFRSCSCMATKINCLSSIILGSSDDFVLIECFCRCFGFSRSSDYQICRANSSNPDSTIPHSQPLRSILWQVFYLYFAAIGRYSEKVFSWFRWRLLSKSQRAKKCQTKVGSRDKIDWKISLNHHDLSFEFLFQYFGDDCFRKAHPSVYSNFSLKLCCF